MKRVSINETAHQWLNPSVTYVNEHLSDKGYYLAFKLEDRMAERGLTVRALAKLSGLRLATISDLCNGNKSSVNLQHVTLLMAVLRLTSITDLVEVVVPEAEKEICLEESAEWKRTGELPSLTKEIADQIQKGEA